MKFRLLISLLVIAMPALASGGADTSGRREFFFRGTEYTKIFSPESGTPFLDTRGIRNGWVSYYGSLYSNVELQYDLEDDQLISLDRSGTVRMQLVKQKVNAFAIGDRKFIRLPARDMFFEQVYHGAHDVLIRWQKVFTRTGTDEGKYKLYKSYYVFNGDVPEIIQSSKDLHNYFGKHSDAIREYLRDQNISFRKEPEKAIVAVVSYANKQGWNAE